MDADLRIQRSAVGKNVATRNQVDVDLRAGSTCVAVNLRQKQVDARE